MIKKYIIITAWCGLLIPFSLHAVSEGNKKDETLLSAIEDSNVKLVERFLESEGIDLERNKSLLLEMAHSRVEHYQNIISQGSRVQDLSRFLWGARLGAVATIAGAVVTMISHKNKHEQVVPFFKDPIRVGALTFSVMAAVGAISCGIHLGGGVLIALVNQKVVRRSRTSLKKARIIEDLIKNISFSTENRDLK